MSRPRICSGTLQSKSSPEACPHALTSATEVRYGAKSTAATVVTYAELAQSYQYQARCSFIRTSGRRSAMPWSFDAWSVMVVPSTARPR